MTNYSSYLIRHWLLGADAEDQRHVFDIEHLQSGRRKRIENLSEAQSWIETVTSEQREPDLSHEGCYHESNG